MEDENPPPEEAPVIGGPMPPSNEMHPEDGSSKMHEDRGMGVGDHHNHDARPLGDSGDGGAKPEENFSRALRPLFLGNLSTICTAPDIEEIFHRPIIPVAGPSNGDPNRPIPVERVDLKRGFCFVFLKDADTPEDKLRVEQFVSEINGMNIDKVSKALRSEFARGDGRIKRKEDARRAQITPSETLFVVNFNEDTTKREDLQSLFQPFGELIRIDMKRNYAFVQFSTVDEARRAKDSTDGGKLDQSQITVEYVARKMGEGRDRRRGDRDRDRDRMRGDRIGYGRGPPDYGRRDDRYDDRGFRGRDYGRRDDRYDDRGFRGRDRSPGRDRDGGIYRRRSRSRSRSPGGYRRGRSRSPEPRMRDHYDDRGRDDYRGGGSYRDGGGRGRSNERDYRDSGRERSSEREYRGDRGYRSERGYVP